KSGRYWLRRNPDSDLANAVQTLSVRARSIHICVVDFRDRQEECESAVNTFCETTTTLLHKPKLTAEQRGSLFALLIDRVRHAKWLVYESHPKEDPMRDPAVSAQFYRIEDCVYDAALDGGQVLDISKLRLQLLDLRNRNLRAVVWKEASVEGYF